MQLNLDTAAFLRDYWQKQPLLIRNGLADFVDLIEPELLAGLAMEDGVDARIIQQTASGWHVEHGPFSDYEAFGEQDWTLLVQAVNEWFPEVQSLLSAFRFLPDWRVDDVMVSFATENGGVGAHLDQYDVFIIQGAGSRHWRVGERLHNAAEYCPHPDLKQLQNSNFAAVIDAVLAPGDVLYIPAGCPHHGVAIEPSLNYSVGFRAPNSAEWLAQLADQLLASEQNFPRYTDPDDGLATRPFQISNAEVQQVRDLLLQQLASTAGAQAIAQVMSQSKRPLPQAEDPITPAQLLSFAATDMMIGRTPGARVLTNEAGQLFANGELVEGLCRDDDAALELLNLVQEQPLANYAATFASEAGSRVLCELLNQGVFYLVQEVEPEQDDD
ncbi:cupin domain-containing protein [Pseudidiomarina insulisalsae]|uniref:Cupin n=1 Tax=Pseudidiomarina insulisalsae TaxID=575789 RepID=A0A432YH97_9GAMM|nr:cupin domain-containing protein [Pseudidiomarina insulisalsae]RUO60331.1 cupin [Pseudidiomarina insulisalsae]